MQKDLQWRRKLMLLFVNVLIWLMTINDVRCAGPTFLLPQPQPLITVLSNERTVLSCAVKYNVRMTSFDVEWYKDTTKMKANNNIKIYIMKDKDKGIGVMQFEATSSSDSGSYRCEVLVNTYRINRLWEVSVTSNTFAGLQAKHWMFVAIVIVLLLLCFVVATICLVCKGRKLNSNYMTSTSGDQEKMIPMKGDIDSSKFHSDLNLNGSKKSQSRDNTYNRTTSIVSPKRSKSDDNANGAAGRQSQKNSVGGLPSRKPLPILPKKVASRTQSDNANVIIKGKGYTNDMSTDDDHVFDDNDENFYSEVGKKNRGKAMSDPTDSPIMSRANADRKHSEEYMYVTPNVFHTPEVPKSNNHNKLRRHSSDQSDNRTLEAFRNKLRAENPYASTRKLGKEQTIDKYEKQRDEDEVVADEDFYLDLQELGNNKETCQEETESQAALRKAPPTKLQGIKNHGIFKTSQQSVRKPLRF